MLEKLILDREIYFFNYKSNTDFNLTKENIHSIKRVGLDIIKINEAEYNLSESVTDSEHGYLHNKSNNTYVFTDIEVFDILIKKLNITHADFTKLYRDKISKNINRFYKITKSIDFSKTQESEGRKSFSDLKINDYVYEVKIFSPDNSNTPRVILKSHKIKSIYKDDKGFYMFNSGKFTNLSSGFSVDANGVSHYNKKDLIKEGEVVTRLNGRYIINFDVAKKEYHKKLKWLLNLLYSRVEDYKFLFENYGKRDNNTMIYFKEKKLLFEDKAKSLLNNK